MRRLSYGANLATSILFVQQDAALNRQNEDRFELSGLAFAGRAPIGFAAQKAEGMRIMTDLIAGWYPVNSRPSITWAFVSRRAFFKSSVTLPPIIFIFKDSTTATEIRYKLLNSIRMSDTQALRNARIEPVLTRATTVRVEILRAICRILSVSVIRCVVHARGHSPQLNVTSGAMERVYGFVESCQVFGHLLTADSLQFAYRSAGRAFHNRLSATFLVLVDGSQPIAKFFVPASRPQQSVTVGVSATTGSSAGGSSTAGSTTAGSNNAVGPVVAAPVSVAQNYLQRTLHAPIPSGSGSQLSLGRKRPAEASCTPSKRSAT